MIMSNLLSALFHFSLVFSFPNPSDPSAEDFPSENPLWDYIAHDRTDYDTAQMLNEVIQASGPQAAKKLVTASSAGGAQALHYAARSGKIPMMILLRGYGADLFAVDSQKRSALHWAMLGLLLNYGPAGLDERLDSLSYLVRAGIPADQPDAQGRSVLMDAALFGNLDAVNRMLELGANPDAQDAEGSTALILAASQGHQSVVELLIQGNASLDHMNHAGNTALLASLKNGHEIVARDLLERGASLLHFNKDGKTALHIAAEKNEISPDFCRHLIECRAPINQIDHAGKPAVIEAIRNSWYEKVPVFLESNKIKMEAEEFSISPLQCLAECGHVHFLDMALRAGGKLWSKNSLGTSLHHAAAQDQGEMIQALMSRGADVNAQNSQGQTPLFLAVQNSRYWAASSLLGFYADPNLKDASGMSPALLSFSSEFKESRAQTPLINLFLMNERTDLNQQSPSGDGMLHFLARRGLANEIQMLADRKIDVNLPGFMKRTPLMAAIDAGQTESLKVLIEMKANPFLQDSNGLDAFGLAKEKGHQEIIDLLAAAFPG